MFEEGGRYAAIRGFFANFKICLTELFGFYPRRDEGLSGRQEKRTVLVALTVESVGPRAA